MGQSKMVQLSKDAVCGCFQRFLKNERSEERMMQKAGWEKKVHMKGVAVRPLEPDPPCSS